MERRHALTERGLAQGWLYIHARACTSCEKGRWSHHDAAAWCVACSLHIGRIYDLRPQGAQSGGAARAAPVRDGTTARAWHVSSKRRGRCAMGSVARTVAMGSGCGSMGERSSRPARCNPEGVRAAACHGLWAPFGVSSALRRPAADDWFGGLMPGPGMARVERPRNATAGQAARGDYVGVQWARDSRRPRAA